MLAFFAKYTSTGTSAKSISGDSFSVNAKNNHLNADISLIINNRYKI